MPCRRGSAQLRRSRNRRGPAALRLLQEVARPELLTGRATSSPTAQATSSPRPEATPPPAIGPRIRAFVDLHCHTSASFDSLARPAAVARAAAARGLTHLAITDHERIDGALSARAAAPDGLTIIVGEEIRTRDGDLIGLFLDRAIPPGLSAEETIAAVREQGGVVGMPHPFDRLRGSLARGQADDRLATLAGSVDFIEAWNARLLLGNGNARAAALAFAAGVPGVAVSDAHTVIEVGVASTILDGDPSTPEGLRDALAGDLVLRLGRASAYVRLFTPAAKLVQRLRRHGRIRATGASSAR
ncbi:MAG TPA: PHP domain-containing protein [Candidatus Eisenbacteria bacterium]|nr:PHP domain-containing protein [Candidatus Eisenbacteria bacterium]